MEKTIKIGNKEVKMKATAATPIHYRNVFKGHDMLKELGQMDGDNFDTEMYLRLMFIMSGEFRNMEFEEWLDQFELMDMFEALNETLDFWNDSTETQSIDNSKKAEADGN